MAERNDLIMVAQALRNGWTVPDVEVEKALALIAELLADPNATPRQKERAKKTLAVIEESRK